MALIKDRAIIEDSWSHIEDDGPIPSVGGVIVPIGVRLESGDGPDVVLNDLDRLDLIAVPFAQFKDGRGYSTARLLRQRYGFKGELRAVGNVLRDQLALMERCGFDSYEYEGGVDAVTALTAFGDIGVVYQSAADKRTSAAAERNHPAKAFANGTSG